jgi:serine phosphatase RsbU (regulator of sigma subunit)/anti-sigma regulatory factor (Ser/Thr protein kinase)
MALSIKKFWRNLIGEPNRDENRSIPIIQQELDREAEIGLEFSGDDPIVAYFQSAPGAVEIDKINLQSPALETLKNAGTKLVVPLISQGELIGLLNLGGRLSEQDYSVDDQRLLNNLASQAAPAVRVAQLVRQQQIEVRERERLEQEMRVARIIQETLLPKSVPQITGWQAYAYWQPARAVGGDFYDFIYLPGGKLGIVIGDVTDKGVPAALVMATTRSILRSITERVTTPGKVLKRLNNMLVTDIPRNMFVTCLYAVLDPASGHLQYANAGHNLPFRRGGSGVDELRATGMPLGLMPDMNYEESEADLAVGDSILLYSDGIVEAHNQQRQMFSFDRLRNIIQVHPGGATLVEFLLTELADFTGDDWEQEDDVTFVTLERNQIDQRIMLGSSRLDFPIEDEYEEDEEWKILVEFQLPSQAGMEREAMDRVAEAVSGLNIPKEKLNRLLTAVAEATMNAIEHGNHFDPDIPVHILVQLREGTLCVRIKDEGGGIIVPEQEDPNIEAKLIGEQSPRGWGLFLIKNMVDQVEIISDDKHHTIVLYSNVEGGQDAS